MGSFNTSCFVSNQVIAPQDICRIVPIVQSSTYNDVVLQFADKSMASLRGIANSTCYADCYWKPLSGFIPAEYDDYGQFKLIFSPKTRRDLLSFFHDVYTKCPTVLQGDNEYHDLPFDFAQFLSTDAPDIHKIFTKKSASSSNVNDELVSDEPVRDLTLNTGLDAQLTACWNYIFKVASKHRLFIYHSQTLRPLQFAVMHEVAYESLIETSSSGENWEGEPMAISSFLKRTLKEARAQGEDAMKRFGKKTDSKESLPGTAESSVQTLDNSFYFEWAMADTLRSSLERISGNCRLGNSRQEYQLLSKLCKGIATGAVSDDEFVERTSFLVADRYAIAGLECFGIRFSPMVYSGQDYSNEEGQAYVRFVEKISAKVTRGCLTRMYGEFNHYAFEANSEAQVLELMKLASYYDAAAEIVTLDVSPAVNSVEETSHPVRVVFACTLEVDDLKDMMGDVADSSRMVDTLSLVEPTERT